MNVKKFGGSSLADADKIRQTVEIIRQSATSPLCVVLSAMKGVTNLLVEAAICAEKGDQKYKENIETIREKHLSCLDDLFADKKSAELQDTIEKLLLDLSEILHGVELVRECSLKSMDLIMSFGERLNCMQVAEYLNFIDIPAQFIDSRDIIKTDSTHGKGNVNFERTYREVKSKLHDADRVIPIICGFIASDESGRTTTLGRNGSDYTASIIGAALDADKVEIWTDVDGVLTADPRIVPAAFVIPQLSIQEAMELSFFGAEVIHPYTLVPTTDKNIPVYIKNTLNPSAEGTVITKDYTKKKRIITGIASIDDLSLINIEGGGMMGMPGIASRIFSSLAEADVNIIMITQASSEHSISILCRSEETAAAVNKLNENLEEVIKRRKIQKIDVVDNLVIIAVIGENMIGQIGLTGELFSAVGEEKINILAIAQGSSERNISFVIRQKDKNKALNAVHKKFIG
ncbi:MULTISPECIES: aspartate kinase [unclassified Oceanispirochaeta]|uniref:aspartate kinase n=1 Tax=unclassified Oceanispirochaeta TaxID=2635722 RepID=UPI000E090650|nr:MULTISPECIES: aspartate kinase [unclassified Oceanispirochaeta]MBF9015245.1 aspartate kinase [Oceanispirochaeta sp. M2]NPD71703.1 aspartate kinase [Oceanispirochaeta sp. M1]RDG32897.1 ACT domain-containing protein [Oceanispirochaeta sp. M1]